MTKEAREIIRMLDSVQNKKARAHMLRFFVLYVYGTEEEKSEQESAISNDGIEALEKVLDKIEARNGGDFIKWYIDTCF